MGLRLQGMQVQREGMLPLSGQRASERATSGLGAQTVSETDGQKGRAGASRIYNARTYAHTYIQTYMYIHLS